MTITREQVRDLRPGDVVEIRDERYPGFLLSGPVHEDHTELAIGPVLLRYSDGEPMRGNVRTLTVISRAPRLYVNHPRTEPVPGDVVRDADKPGAEDPRVWIYTGPTRSTYTGWASATGHGSVMWVRPSDVGVPQVPARLRLLVDGETGMAATS